MAFPTPRLAVKMLPFWLLSLSPPQIQAFQAVIGSNIRPLQFEKTASLKLTTCFHSTLRNDDPPKQFRSQNSQKTLGRLFNGKDDNDSTTTTTKPIPTKKTSSSNVKIFELDDAFEDDGENVVGTKFFGGNAVKDELYDPEEEERALELQKVKKEAEKEMEYKRFEDEGAFGDELGKRVGESLQIALNAILYGGQTNEDGVAVWKEDSALKWVTPFGKKSGNASPFKELKEATSFYNKLDIAILSGKTIKSEGKFSTVEIRWDIGALWPNPWESRVLLTGTSTLTVVDDKASNTITVVKQEDRLDGSSPMDVVSSLSSQLSPRFWDIYHIGMTPSTELDPRFDPSSVTSPRSSSGKLAKLSKKGLFSSYKLSYLPPRLVTQPSLLDVNGRSGRTAQALPNHGFTTAIKTMGPNKEFFVPVSPIEVTISKVPGDGSSDGDVGGSLITWTVPLPPEFASNTKLPLPLMEEESDVDEEVDANDGVDNKENSESLANQSNSPITATSPYSRRPSAPPPKPPTSLQCSYSLRPARLVATLPYAGNPQDEAVTDLRRKLYQQAVEQDGFKPKLDPVTKRPIFFFWMNDAKACFTRQGGLGMAVYEWRAEWSQSNEVGIELDL
mmetsp:Transcript_29556/g.59670  ORF Transcript_29556/g.59670 Transcript_29556/m.59670 type:complete len:616 (-) Transcript_29556:146-1993(-)